jgi:hypothetical protein
MASLLRNEIIYYWYPLVWMRRGVFYVIHMFCLTCLLLKVVFNTITLTPVYPKGQLGVRHGRDRMVVGFTTTYAIHAYHHWSCEYESHSDEVYSIQHYVIKFDSEFVTDLWFSLDIPVPSTNKTDCHNISEILLKVVLNTITHPNPVDN